MNVEFLRDYQGTLTGERFYLAGQVVDIDDGAAQAIIAEGAAIAEGKIDTKPAAMVESMPKPKAKK